MGVTLGDSEDLREGALKGVAKAYYDLNNAKEKYGRALELASDLGISNTVIARRIGISETGVRLFLKRRREKRQK